MTEQKTATAVAHCKRGHGLIKVNGRPLKHIEPATLQYKLQEPILLLGKVSLEILSLFYEASVEAVIIDGTGFLAGTRIDFWAGIEIGLFGWD